VGTITLREVRRKLNKLGFVKKRSKGKHEVWVNEDQKIVMVSHGDDDVGPKLLKMICSQAGIAPSIFLRI